MGWLVTLGVLILLALFPVGLGLTYEKEKFLLKLRLAGIPIPLDLDKLLNLGSRPEKKEEKPEPTAAKPSGGTPAPGKKLNLETIKPFLRLGLDFLGDLRQKLRVDRMELNLVLAGEDPCDLAVNYGRTWAALGNLSAHLERLLVIRSRDLQVQCDFTAEKTRVTGRLDLHMTLGRLLTLGLGYGFRAVKLLLSMKKRKGGASS